MTKFEKISHCERNRTGCASFVVPVALYGALYDNALLAALSG